MKTSPGSTQTAMPTTSLERGMDWRKRHLRGEEEVDAKRPRYNIYFRLESESSITTDDDTESVYSIQDKETDVARDTSDTDTKSETSDDGLEVELEYEVASLSGDEDFPFGDNYSSSGTEDLQAAEASIAAVLCDSSLEAWATDGETSDSSIDGGVGGLTDFWTCVQCKSQNNNRLFRYCEKCFQSCWICKSNKSFKCFPLCTQCFKVRKNLFPPRPRGTRKRKLHKKDPPVKLDTLQSCLSRLTQDTGTRSTLSQDSGLGSSQELASLDFDQIVVPEHLKKTPLQLCDSKRLSEDSTCSEDECDEAPAAKRSKLTTKNLRSQSEYLGKINYTSIEKSDLNKSKSDNEQFYCAKSESHKSDSGISEQSKLSFEGNSTDDLPKNSLSDQKELCIMCNIAPKNGIFLHGNIGHCCCCYKCAMKSWKSSKRCPICNRKVNNVVKLFTM